MSRRARLLLLPVIYLGFVSLGLPDGTLGVAWPRMHVDFRQPLAAAGWLMLVATLLSATASFGAGRILRHFRTGPVVLASCLLTCSALLLTSRAPSFGWLLAFAVPLGLGAGAVDAALNTFVARHYTGRHMNWLHACWGIGASSGPLLMTWALAGTTGWRGGYLLIGAIQFALVALFAATLHLWNAVPDQVAAGTGTAAAQARQGTCTANSEAGWLSAFAFLVYVAIEFTAGLWAFSVLVLARGVPQATAGLCVSIFYLAITGGRIANGFVVDRWGNRRIVNRGALLAVAGAALFVFARSAPTAALALGVLGLAFAPIYPGLMHEVPRRFVPEAVSTIIGRQSGAACIGAAIFPAAVGWLAGHVSLETIAGFVLGGAVLLVATVRRLDRIS